MDMNLAKWIAAVGIIAMTAALVYGFTAGDFATDGGELLKNPWGIVSMVDLYTGFVLFSGWVLFREKSLLVAFLWVILIMVLGFFTASIYALLAAITSKGDWKKFWMGWRRNE